MNINFKQFFGGSTYRRETSGLDSGENLYVEWYDGSSWTNLETVQTASFSDGLQVKTCDPNADGLAGFKIRFRLNASASDETAFIDYVGVTGRPE